MIEVNDTEFDQNPQKYREIAREESVVIGSTDKPSVVLVSRQRFDELRSLDHQVHRVADWTDEELAEMRDQIDAVCARQSEI